MVSERLPWCTPDLFDLGEREEQAALVVYAVEREAEETRKLEELIAKVLQAAFGGGKAAEADA